MTKKIIQEKVRFLSEGFELKEEVNPKTFKVEGVKIKGKAITADKPTRNNVAYTQMSLEQTHQSLVGKPFLDSHNDTSIRTHPPFGHVTKSWMEGNSLFYEADIDPAETTFIRKAKRGDIAGVSIQVLVNDVEQMDGYVKANVSEFLELSSVLIPGDGSTEINFTEKLKESFGMNVGGFKEMDLMTWLDKVSIKLFKKKFNVLSPNEKERVNEEYEKLQRGQPTVVKAESFKEYYCPNCQSDFPNPNCPVCRKTMGKEKAYYTSVSGELPVDILQKKGNKTRVRFKKAGLGFRHGDEVEVDSAQIVGESFKEDLLINIMKHYPHGVEKDILADELKTHGKNPRNIINKAVKDGIIKYVNRRYYLEYIKKESLKETFQSTWGSMTRPERIKWIRKANLPVSVANKDYTDLTSDEEDKLFNLYFKGESFKEYGPVEEDYANISRALFNKVPKDLTPEERKKVDKEFRKIYPESFSERFMAYCPHCKSKEHVKFYEDAQTGTKKYKCFKCGEEFDNKQIRNKKKKIRMIGEFEGKEEDKYMKSGIEPKDLNVEKDEGKNMEEVYSGLHKDEDRSKIVPDEVFNLPKDQAVQILVKDFNYSEDDAIELLKKAERDELARGAEPVPKSRDVHKSEQFGPVWADMGEEERKDALNKIGIIPINIDLLSKRDFDDLGPYAISKLKALGIKEALDIKPEDKKVPEDKSVTERTRRFKFKCMKCGYKYKKELVQPYKETFNISCPACGSKERRLYKKAIKNNFRQRLFVEELTTSNGSALYDTALPKKKKVENFATKVFKEEVIKEGVRERIEELIRMLQSGSYTQYIQAVEWYSRNLSLIRSHPLFNKLEREFDKAEKKWGKESFKEGRYPTVSMYDKEAMKMYKDHYWNLTPEQQQRVRKKFKESFKEEKEKPPKAWFDKTVKALRANPDVDDPEKLAGWIWYHGKESFKETMRTQRYKGYQLAWDDEISYANRDMLVEISKGGVIKDVVEGGPEEAKKEIDKGGRRYESFKEGRAEDEVSRLYFDGMSYDSLTPDEQKDFDKILQMAMSGFNIHNKGAVQRKLQQRESFREQADVKGFLYWQRKTGGYGNPKLEVSRYADDNIAAKRLLQKLIQQGYVSKDGRNWKQ